MKKINKQYFLIIILIIIITSIIITKPLSDLDEIWNYNFAKNIAEGKMPYKDFNMITTPFVPIISAIFLKLFANELIVMRILAIILCTAILFITYKILELLKVDEQINYTFLIASICILYNYFCIDYNFFILFNVLLIIFIELKLINKNEILLMSSKTDILLGILAGICICAKQTTGVLISIGLIGYNFINISNFNEFKLFIKKAIYRIIGILVPLLLLAVYFTFNNLWYDFFYYCIWGIKTFSNYIPYSYLLKNSNIFIKLLAIVVPIFLISFIFYIFKNKKNRRELDKNVVIIIVYSILEISVMFPISDNIHFLIGVFPTMIGIIYMISVSINKNIKLKMNINQYLKALNILTIIIIIIMSIIIFFNYVIVAKKYNMLNHFKYIPQLEEKSIMIKKIDEYIQSQNKNVYILDASSAVYTIPINQYTKNYDMLLKGNLGADGEDGIIKDLENDENYIILIKGEQHKRNWQNPEKIREYIIKNMCKTGEIEEFDIYEK